MGTPDDRRHMVLAVRLETDVAQQHDLVAPAISSKQRSSNWVGSSSSRQTIPHRRGPPAQACRGVPPVWDHRQPSKSACEPPLPPVDETGDLDPLLRCRGMSNG